jgi:nucleosome-remodeling factor subunit BPTF
VVPGPTSILPKGTVVGGTQTGQQSLIRIQPAGGAGTPTASSPAVTPTQQKVQIVPGPDGKFQVRGLLPGKLEFCRV